MNELLKKFFIGLIKVYQLTLSPFLGANCRFTPTCSQYALECFQVHSLPLATLKSVKRICRCHPFSAGGYDPVQPETSLPILVSQHDSPQHLQRRDKGRD